MVPFWSEWRSGCIERPKPAWHKMQRHPEIELTFKGFTLGEGTLAVT
jgi:hypothetical protein